MNTTNLGAGTKHITADLTTETEKSMAFHSSYHEYKAAERHIENIN